MRRFRNPNWLRDPRCRIADRLGLLLGQRDMLTPPAALFDDPDRMDGSHGVRDFVMVGENTVEWLISEGLQPTHRVLEVGCGIGRMAIPLMRHLDGRGSYAGLEIDQDKVRYCVATVGSVASHFQFRHADVFSKYYNPSGATRGRDYAFPYDDNFFDFVFLTSVFTHMLPEDMEHYVSEISRVMAPGAICISSFWLTRSRLGPPYHRYSEVSEIYDLEEPEHGVVYVEEYVRECLDHRGLRIRRVWRGSRFGESDPGHNRSSQQDIVIATKAGS
jgi:SAM-dependent methyltransferase